MSAMNTPANILEFQVYGPMAHFKKYYSNKSSMTYAIPPRTVIAGMIGSILEWPRDTYYERLSPEVCKIGVSLNGASRKLMQCMNYREKSGGYTQVRLELLLPVTSMLEFTIYFAHQEEEVYKRLQQAVEARRQGFGLYLGQRPFRGYISYGENHTARNIDRLEDYSGTLFAATPQDNVEKLERSSDVEVTTASMPINMRQVEDGREPDRMGMVTYERTGGGLQGTFREVLQVQDRAISFFTPCN